MSAPAALEGVDSGAPAPSGDPPPPSYPRLASSSPPLLPLPTSLTPCFAPLGATVPLPPLRRRSLQRPSANRSSASATPAHVVLVGAPPRRVAPRHATGQSAYAAGTTRGGDAPWRNSFGHPGAPFCDSVLLHFHQMVVPAPSGAPDSPDSSFWIRPDSGSVAPSKVQVANALSFCFSRPPPPVRGEQPRPRPVLCQGCRQELSSFHRLPWEMQGWEHVLASHPLPSL